MTVIALDLGGTKLAASLVDPSGLQGPTLLAPTPAQDGPAAILDVAVELAERLLSSTGRPEILGLAVASAGVIDSGTGTVTSATDIIAGWAGTPIAASLHARLGLPVIVINDVQAHALGEASHGAGAELDSLLLVAAGTGLGGGFVTNRDELLLGAHHAAGHLGHVPCEEAAGLTCSCGAVGHLECIASGSGLMAATSGCYESAAALALAAAAGEPAAQRWLEVSGRALGRAIGGWINLLDPAVVVVTGGLAHAGPIWWDPLLRAVQREVLPVTRARVVPAALGASAALIGAATFAAQKWGMP